MTLMTLLKKIFLPKQIMIISETEKHINTKIREYLKPFRIFLSAIGRFPYTVVNDSKKRNILQAIKKTSCAPIMELGAIQEHVLKDNDNEGT